MRPLAYLPPLAAWSISLALTLGLPLAGLWLVISALPGAIPVPSVITTLIDRALVAFDIAPVAMTSIPLPGPALIVTVAKALTVLSVAFLVLLLLSYALTPLGRLVRSQGRVARVSKSSALHAGLADVALGCDQKMPALWVIESKMLNAWAMAAPGGRRAVTLTTGLLASVTDDELRWVFAHELAHLHYGDAAGTGLWLASLQWAASARRTRASLLNHALMSVRRMPLVYLLYPGLWVLCLAFVCAADAAERTALAVLVFLMRSASRRAEFRADRFATGFMGQTPGIDLLSRFAASSRPFLVDLVGTHPSPRRRIQHIQALKRSV